MIQNQNQRVIVSGLGVVSALGSNCDQFWNNLIQAKSGYSKLDFLEERGTPFKIAGSIVNDKLEESWPGHDRTTQLGLSAAAQALADAGVTNNTAFDHDDTTVAVVMGTTCGANGQLESDGFEDSWFSGQIADCRSENLRLYDHGSLSTAISKEYGFDGPSYVVGTACASGNHAVGEGLNMIRDGQADMVVCGGADSLTLLPVFGFYAMKSLATKKCTPFDRERDGMVIGEASAVLVLESEESALRRGIEPKVEVKSWSINCDAAKFAAPLESGERFEQLVLSCLDAAKLDLTNIDYINAHGTGTQSNDAMEANGIARLYSEGNVEFPPVSAIKGQLGHTLGASGALEALVCVLALQHGVFLVTLLLQSWMTE